MNSKFQKTSLAALCTVIACAIVVITSVRHAEAQEQQVTGYDASGATILGLGSQDEQPTRYNSCGSSLPVACSHSQTFDAGPPQGQSYSANASVSIFGGDEPSLRVFADASSSSSSATGSLVYFFRVAPTPGIDITPELTSLPLGFEGEIYNGAESAVANNGGTTFFNSAAVNIYDPNGKNLYTSGNGPPSSGQAAEPVQFTYVYYNQFMIGPQYEVYMTAYASAYSLNGSASDTAVIDPTITIDPEYAADYEIIYSPGLLEGVSSTPLPSTWTMLLAGFVGLGLFAYRGSKKNAAGLAAVR